VYPIFAIIGGATGLCAFHLGRHLFTSPDVRLMKSDRAASVLEEKRFTKEGAVFREHALRRRAEELRSTAFFAHAALLRSFLRSKQAQIFPRMNQSLGGEQFYVKRRASVHAQLSNHNYT